jgi:hypothetical protein
MADDVTYTRAHQRVRYLTGRPSDGAIAGPGSDWLVLFLVERPDLMLAGRRELGHEYAKRLIGALDGPRETRETLESLDDWLVSRHPRLIMFVLHNSLRILFPVWFDVTADDEPAPQVRYDEEGRPDAHHGVT